MFRHHRKRMQTPQTGMVAQQADGSQVVRGEGWAHGFCYWADQRALVFGSDRAEPVSHRPVVSVRKTGAGFLVLPATSQPRTGYFPLQPDDIFRKRHPDTPPGASYLCHRAETLESDALNLFGVLRHGLRIRIMDWLRQRYGGADHVGD